MAKKTAAKKPRNTWRFNAKYRSWQVLAIGDQWQPGDEVEVAKKDGTTTTVVAGRVSRSFAGRYGETKGLQCCFITPQRYRGYECEECGEFITVEQIAGGSRCWETGAPHAIPEGE